jgi:hypothetical protein
LSSAHVKGARVLGLQAAWFDQVFGNGAGAGPAMKGRSKVVVVPHKRQWRLNRQAGNVVSVLVHAYIALHAAV